MNDNEQLGMN